MNIQKLIKVKTIILSPVFIGIVFFLFLQLQLFNYNLSYRDEGFLLNNAQRIANGEIPYKDFSLAITPGAFYTQALIMKIFGNYIVIDRILYIFCVISILILVSRLFKFTTYLNNLFLLSLGIMYAGIGWFASYNIYSLTLILLALLLFNILRNHNNIYVYSFLLGISNFAIIIFKQSYGGIFFFTFLILIFFFTKRKYLTKNFLYYLLGNLMLLGIFLFYFYSNNSLQELKYNLFSFASSVKNDRLPFILTSLLFVPFFFLVLNYIKEFSIKKVIYMLLFFLAFFALYIFIAPDRIYYVLSFYKDISIYYFIFFFIAPIIALFLFFKSKDKDAKNISITSISALSIFLASSFSGRDYTTIIIVSPLYIPLIIYFMSIFKKYRFPSINITATFFIVLFILPSIFYLTQNYGKLYGIGYKKEAYSELNIEKAKYINIPVNQKKDLELLENYIKNTTSTDTKLFCFPYCPLSNFLTERSNASYFNFFYKFKLEDQARTIRDMETSKKLVILLQKKGEIEKEADFEDNKLNILRKYILKNYKLRKLTQNFYVYSK